MNIAISINSLSKTYHAAKAGWRRLLVRGDAEPVHALCGVDLEVGTGRIFGLVGRNGQGKTTLTKCIAGLITPTAGTIQVFGLDTERDRRSSKQCIGLVASDERSFYGRLTARQNLLFFSRLLGMTAAAALRRMDELADLFDFGDMLARRFQELSSGNKQRLALLRALLTNPPLLLLDEPTRSLDPLAAGSLRALLREWVAGGDNRTAFITSHNLQEVSDLCDEVGILSKGELKLVATMEELTERYAGSEEISLRMRRGPNGSGLQALENDVPAFRVEDEEGCECRLVFRNPPGERHLHRVLSTIIEAGAEVQGMETHRMGLLELLAEIEESG